MGARKWIVLAVASYLVFLANYMQFQLSGFAYLIIPKLGLTAAHYSSLLTAPMLTAVFASVPLGALADRFGAKRVVLAANGVALVAAFARVGADSYGAYLVSMALLGLSPASLNANLIKVFGHWFDERINLAMGTFYACASAGVVAALLTSYLFDDLPSAYLMTACALALGVALWALVVPDDGSARQATVPATRYMGVAARSRSVWLIAVALGLGLASTTALSGFFPQFLEFDHGLSAQQSGFITALFTLGSIVGAAAGPAVCYQLGRFKPVLVPLGILGSVLMAVMGLLPECSMGAAMLGAGLVAAVAGPVLEALPYSLSAIGEKYAGSAGGIVGMVSMGMAFLIPLGIAAVCGESYVGMFLLMGCAFLASTGCVVLLPEIGSE